MRTQLKIRIEDIDLFKKQLIIYGEQSNKFAFLDSSDFTKKNNKYTYYEYDFLAALSSVKEINGINKNNFQKLDHLINQNKDWLFGF